MGKRRPKPEPLKYTLMELVDAACSDAEELRDELNDWHDNLPEAFQNGSKGEALQEAMDNLESGYKPDVPAAHAGDELHHTRLPLKRRPSRADRLDQCKAMLETAAEYARDRAATLTEFADACDEAVSSWDSVEFPGLYG